MSQCVYTNVYDLCIQQNASYDNGLYILQDDAITPVNITSWSFTGSIKENYTDTVPVLYFTTSVISVASASLRLMLGAEDTWKLTGSRYVYDLISYNPTINPPETLRLMQGKVHVKSGVTMP